MKKSFYLLAIFVIAMFIGALRVEARENMTCTYGNQGRCTLSWTKTNNYEEANNITVTLKVGEGRDFSGLTVNTNDWIVKSKTTPTAVDSEGYYVYTYNLVLKTSTMTKQSYTILQFDTEVKRWIDVNCELTYSVAGYCETRYACSVNNGIYYDMSGNIVSQSEYKSSCGCRATRGLYFDNDGNQTTELNYIKVCLKPTCVQLSDGTFMGSNGSAVNQDEFASQCGYKCGKINDTYYDKNGNPVANEQEMVASCNPGTCKPSTLSDGTIIYFGTAGTLVTKEVYEDTCFEKPKCKLDNGKYYDKDGNVTDEETYAKECTTITCRILSDGTIYGKEGKVVDKLTYEKQCAVHTCEILSDGTHYNKEGKEVTKEEYLKSCYGCRKENNKYYDENGKETTEANWNVMCTPHKCTVIGDKYFDDKGKIVPKDVYDKACTNPKTGSIDGKMLAYIVSGVLLTGAILFVTLKNTKLRRL